MTDTHRNLVAALVSAITRDLTVPVRLASGDGGRIVELGRSADNGQSGQICSFAPVGYFEHAESALEPFGVFQPLGANGEEIHRYHSAISYRLRMTVSEIEAHVLANFPQHPVNLQKLIEAFTGLACGQCELLPTTRNWFVPRQEYVALMHRFAEHGYVGQLNERFRWTDEIGDAMYANGLWSEEKEDHGDLERILHERMWNSMPAKSKIRYFMGEFNSIAAADFVSQCFDYETMQWTGEEPQRPREVWASDPTALVLFKTFVEPYRK